MSPVPLHPGCLRPRILHPGTQRAAPLNPVPLNPVTLNPVTVTPVTVTPVTVTPVRQTYCAEPAQFPSVEGTAENEPPAHCRGCQLDLLLKSSLRDQVPLAQKAPKKAPPRDHLRWHYCDDGAPG